MWRRSSFCNGAATCVEVALVEGVVTVRDAKRPYEAVLMFSPEEFAAFLAGVRAGEFDLSRLPGEATGGDAHARASEAATAGVEPPPVSA